MYRYSLPKDPKNNIYNLKEKENIKVYTSQPSSMKHFVKPLNANPVMKAILIPP